MPTYSYECAKCGHITDEFHGMSATPKVACADCGSKRTKKMLGTGSGIIFKGSGFYETDYKNKGKKPAASGSSSGGESKSESKSEGKSESKGESKKSETKKTESTKKAPAA